MKIEVTQRERAVRRRLVRCAAYCRVSDDKDRLLHSLEAQRQHYEDLIPSLKDHILVDVYADEAKSGTNADRPGLQRLLRDCYAGRVDCIFVKSVSRLCRNTVDFLSLVRSLKRIGVEIRFEKENISTLSAEGELMLSLISSIAQEESRSISENIKWSIRKRFGQGKSPHYRLYGYSCESGIYTVIPEQADTVRFIFGLFLSGFSVWKTVRILNEAGLSSPRGRTFSPATVERILTNPAYTGNTLLQREYILDHLTHKREKNRGELNMYRVQNTHPVIVDRDTFDRAQEELAARKAKGRAGWDTQRSWYTDRLHCGECGKGFRANYRSCKSPVVYCKSRNRRNGACPSPSLSLPFLFAALTRATGTPIATEEDFAKHIRDLNVYRHSLEIRTSDGRMLVCPI
ncbi:MAG: recombinase family protein [Clostridia bacterium]|nr:recombinase family protein [Clostridia bacterium]